MVRYCIVNNFAALLENNCRSTSVAPDVARLHRRPNVSLACRLSKLCYAKLTAVSCRMDMNVINPLV